MSEVMLLRVEEYVREDGSSPFRQWFDRLDSQAAAKVTTAMTRLSLGNTSNVKWFEGVGEYVINWGPGYRVYLAREGSTLVVLFTGGTKHRQQADIERALALHAEYKARKKTAARSAGTARRPKGSRRTG
jgi:putative addiction module killer protein